MGDTPLTRGVWGTRFSDKPICEMNILYIRTTYKHTCNIYIYIYVYALSHMDDIDTDFEDGTATL